jgi:chemotaxis response regulator CheB
MNERRVLVIGNSLFAETLTDLLSNVPEILVVGEADNAQSALSLLQSTCPDVVIMADCVTNNASTDLIGLVVTHPQLPLIRADLTTNTVQVITSRSVSARRDDLLAVLNSLPTRCE